MDFCNDKKGLDKTAHFLLCLLMAYVGHVLLAAPGILPAALAAAVVFVTVMAVAFGKELYDRRKRGGHFCVWDLLADLYGAAAGLILGWATIWYVGLFG